MQDFNNIFFNRFLKWGVLIAIASIYYVTYKDPVAKKVSEKLEEIEEERVESPADIIVPEISLVDEKEAGRADAETQKNSIINGMVQNVINKISKTEKGRVVIRGLTEHASQNLSDDEILLRQTTFLKHTIHASDIIKGTGQRVQCNAKVTYDYRAYLPGSIKFQTSYKPEHVPVTIEVGKHQVIPGLELAMIGLQEGARRKVSIPPILGFDATGFGNTAVPKGKIVLYDIEMRTVEGGREPVPAETAFYQLRTLNTGNGIDFVQCGDFVTMSYRFLPEGDEPHQSAAQVNQVTFRAGEGVMPYGLDEALIGLYKHGDYLIDLPPYWQTIHKEDSPFNTVMAETEHPDRIHFQIISIDN